MEKFTKIDELQEAMAFLKRTPDNFYPHLTSFDTLEHRGIPEILERAKSLYKQLNESRGTLLEKKMLYD
jgi:fructose 1,6-bisphosphatase